MVEAVVAFQENFLNDNKNSEKTKQSIRDVVERLREIGLTFTSRHKWLNEYTVVETGTLDQADHIFVGLYNTENKEEFCDLCNNISRTVKPFLNEKFLLAAYVKIKN